MDILEVINKLGLTAGLLVLLASIAQWMKPIVQNWFKAHMILIGNLKKNNDRAAGSLIKIGELAERFKKWPSDPAKFCTMTNTDRVREIVLQMRAEEKRGQA